MDLADAFLDDILESRIHNEILVLHVSPIRVAIGTGPEKLELHMLSEDLVHRLLVLEVFAMIASCLRWMVREMVALVLVLKLVLIEGDVLVLCMESLARIPILRLFLDLAAAIVAVSIPLRSFGLALVGLRQVGVFI